MQLYLSIELPDPHGTLWLDPQAGISSVMDYDDYLWAVQWAWHVTVNSCGKRYASRMTRRGGKQVKVYLHREIAQRARLRKRRGQEVVDHRNGDSLDNRRDNLRWATYSQNNRRG